MKNTLVLLMIVLAAAAFIVAGCTQAPTLNNQNPGANIPSVTDTGANAATPPGTANTPPATANTPPTDTGAAPPATTPAAVKEIKLEAYKFGFRVLNDVQINKGDHVKITVTSTDGIHGFAMPDYNIDISPIGQGETKSAEFIADRSGTFTYFCNVPCGPGHSSMRGSLTVL